MGATGTHYVNAGRLTQLLLSSRAMRWRLPARADSCASVCERVEVTCHRRVASDGPLVSDFDGNTNQQGRACTLGPAAVGVLLQAVSAAETAPCSLLPRAAVGAKTEGTCHRYPSDKTSGLGARTILLP